MEAAEGAGLRWRWRRFFLPTSAFAIVFKLVLFVVWERVEEIFGVQVISGFPLLCACFKEFHVMQSRAKFLLPFKKLPFRI